MPASGAYNRKALSQSRPLLAPNQAALPKSRIAPTTYRRRRSSETFTAVANTRAVVSRPRPSEPNLNFHLLPFADVSFRRCLFHRMHLEVRLDSRFPRHEINFAPSRRQGISLRPIGPTPRWEVRYQTSVIRCPMYEGTTTSPWRAVGRRGDQRRQAALAPFAAVTRVKERPGFPIAEDLKK
jgi:hypothetical protein